VNHDVEVLAAVLFGLAVAHTFATKLFDRLGERHPGHAGLFHLLAEVEVVFGFWAAVLVATMAVVLGPADAIAYAETRQYTEPAFVFAIMVVAASRPILESVQAVLAWTAQVVPVRAQVAQAWMCLALLPLFGSLITEPAAMTLSALVLLPVAFRDGVPERTKYFVLGVLFVNISIGGTLTSFAAPPVLMVAATWGWDNAFMATTFGWKAALAVLFNATFATLMLRKHMSSGNRPAGASSTRIPLAVTAVHFLFLAGIVATAHHPVVFLALLLLFLGFTEAYARYQDPLILREALLVAFFLAGLVVLGGLQRWWLQPLFDGAEPMPLFFGALALTAITDNAALTYLGSLIEGISDEAKYMLVSGAVAGGGLTVIANAPNPAGVTLLKRGFGGHSIGTMGLLLGAIVPTAVAVAAFLLL
jgi:hypothetical protein